MNETLQLPGRAVRGLLLGCLLCATCGNLPAAEEIRAFESRIVVRPDGTLEVEETLRVRVEGVKIRRGIYRDFPTLYRGRWGLRVRVPFRVESVTRDGRPEPWRQEARGNGVRVYFGSPDVFLPAGETTYVFRYTTSRQLGFLENHDELYWNVTGSDWDFPILAASACVKLPPGARVLSAEGYTGPPGSREAGFQSFRRPGCDVLLATTRVLQPGEGFTIVVAWPKGFVTPPARSEHWMDILRANKGVAAGIGGFLVALGYFLAVWWRHGRDPARGVIVPLYGPPGGLTPQDARYLRGLGVVDERSFAAAVLHLATQGALKISLGPDRTYTLTRGGAQPRDDVERKLVEVLFSGRDSLRLEQKNYKILQAARQKLARMLMERHRGAWRTNRQFWVAGLGLSLIPLGISLFDAKEPGAALFMLVWLSIWSLGCAGLAASLGGALRGGKVLAALPLAIFSLPFFGGWVFGLWALLNAASLWVAIVYFLGVGLCMVFLYLLPQPTRETQGIRDRIEGFREYLKVAEADRLNLENPPDRTPALLEKFLPHALALGVEQQWTRKFSDVLQAAGYSPTWYSGRTGSFSPGTFAATVGSSLAAAISSSSTAPGSVSGSRGGGSSGGGGGGGGGGGW